MKKILIVCLVIFSFFMLGLGGTIIYYNQSVEYKETNKEKIKEIDFVIKEGSSANGVIDSLYSNGLIKNKYVGYFYLKTHKDLKIMAGVYKLNTGMNLRDILGKIDSGDSIKNTIAVTFVEGKRVTDYANVIAKNFPYTYEEVMAVIEDREYLNELIGKYSFLTKDLLNDKLYYALEGYLAADTYYFYKDASIKTILEKMISETGKKLEKFNYKDSKYSVHELLTMASIIELEGANKNDRDKVAGVFYNRLNSGWSLGSDVTTYYGAKVELFERDLYQYEIDANNGYNTRVQSMAGKLPIGPICSPSLESINASINPVSHDYYFFVADKNKKTYFTKTNGEHEKIIKELKDKGLWYVYK